MPYDATRMWKLKHATSERTYETETGSDRRTHWQLPRARGLGEGWQGAGISRHKLSHTEWINNKVLLNGTGNYIQSTVKNHMEKDVSKNTCVCVTESLCWTQKSTGHCKPTVLGLPRGAVGKDLPVSAGDRV